MHLDRGWYQRDITRAPLRVRHRTSSVWLCPSSACRSCRSFTCLFIQAPCNWQVPLDIVHCESSQTCKMLLRDLLAHVMLSAAPAARERSISPLHERSTSSIHDRSAPLTTLSLDHDLVALTPGFSANPAPGLSVLATGAAGACDAGWTICGTGCMPIGSVCCAGKGYCDAGEYCTSDDACCAVRGSSHMLRRCGL